MTRFTDLIQYNQLDKMLARYHLTPAELGAGADVFVATAGANSFNGGAGRDKEGCHLTTEAAASFPRW